MGYSRVRVVHDGTPVAQLIFYKSRKGDITFDAFQTEELLKRCMETIDRLVTIAFLTQPLKTEPTDQQDGRWHYVVLCFDSAAVGRQDIWIFLATGGPAACCSV